MSRDFPDGIAEAHEKGAGTLPAPMRWLALWVLAAVLAAAMLGVFGGTPSPVHTAQGPDGVLRVKAPATLRNGEFFEMRMVGQARRPIARPVIAVSGSYWHDLTINTMVPAPASESYDDGFFVFEFDPLKPGQSIEFKIDGQVNPPMFAGTSGVIALRDGDRELARIPVRLKVFP